MSKKDRTNAAERTDIYRNNIKLSETNKITSKNAFDFKLIDVMSEILNSKAADVISRLKKLEKVKKVSFTASSNTSRIRTMVNSTQPEDSEDKLVNGLDEAGITIGLSGKIYAQRVDALLDQTRKVLSNLTIASKPIDVSANDASINDDDCVYGDTSEDLCQENQAGTREHDELFSVDKDESMSDAQIMEKLCSFLASMETANPAASRLLRIADEDEHDEKSCFDDVDMANARKKDETMDPVSMAMLAERDHNGQLYELLTRYTRQMDNVHLDTAQFISDSYQQRKKLLSPLIVFTSILLLANENSWKLISDAQNADVYIENRTHEN